MTVSNGRRIKGLGTRHLPSLGVAAALVAGGAGAAFAVDATGTWSGKWICRQRVGATVQRTERQGSTMLITQRGEALYIEIDGTAYQGRCQDSDGSPTRATGSAVRYWGNAETFTDSSELLDLRIRVNERLGTTRFGARSTVEDAGAAGRCRYRFSRTSDEDPGIAPPLEGTCEPLNVSGHWEGTWVSDVTGESGPVIADWNHLGDFVIGTLSFPPFRDVAFAPPFFVLRPCVDAEFSTGAILYSGIGATLDGTATNDTVTGAWALSDQSDHGTWQLSR